eukprot:3391545-Rhodomonas_salina.1
MHYRPPSPLSLPLPLPPPLSVHSLGHLFALRPESVLYAAPRTLRANRLREGTVLSATGHRNCAAKATANVSLGTIHGSIGTKHGGIDTLKHRFDSTDGSIDTIQGSSARGATEGDLGGVVGGVP